MTTLSINLSTDHHPALNKSIIQVMMSYTTLLYAMMMIIVMMTMRDDDHDVATAAYE